MKILIVVVLIAVLYFMNAQDDFNNRTLMNNKQTDAFTVVSNDR